MLRVLIIADDLTGAADCGVMFREQGMETVVLLGKPGRNATDLSDLRSAEVVAIDADTRCLSADKAAETVAETVRFCGAVNYDGDRPLLFKKVDSTLRGNIAAELAAVLRTRRALISSPARVGILFAPAFPALGRTTVNGRQMVNRVQLEETDLWDCERLRPSADIAQMLSRGGLTCAAIDLALVRGEMSALEKTMVRMANEVDVLVCDAEREEDLQAVSRAGLVLDKGTIWAGSAGLARHLANAAGFAAATASSSPLLCEPRLRGPVLFIVGSQAKVSREQADVLAGTSDVACYRFTANSRFEEKPAREWQEIATLIAGDLSERHDVLVRLDPSDTYANEADRRIARWLAQTLSPCAAHVGGLVATGGDTARAILDVWEIERLTLLREIEPGLPYSTARCGDREILVLTKAGGFGTRETLLGCREFLRKLGRDSDAIESHLPIASRKS